MKYKHKISIHFHPFFYALYPVCALLAVNVSQVYILYALRPLIYILAITTIFLLSFKFLTKSFEKACLLTTTILIFLFSYGHVLYFFRSVTIFGFELGHHRYLAVPYILLFACSLYWILRSKKDLLLLNQAIDVVTFVLLLLPITQIAVYYYQLSIDFSSGESSSIDQEVIAVDNNTKLPDIYYIVLDGYAREDKLSYEYGFDNHEFISTMRELGFYVADCNRSNYNITDFSMASSLNMDYLTSFGTDYRTTGKDRDKLHSLISHNLVRSKLEAAGYQIYAFETGYYFTEWWDADTFLAPNDHLSFYQSLRPFESMLLRNTIVLLLSDSQFVLFNDISKDINFPYQDHVERVRYTIDKLPTLASVQGPKFVYVHLLVPHKPLVFDSEGNIQTDSGFYSLSGDPINGVYFQQGYLEEIEFINSRMPNILNTLIEQSEVEPVIILNSDHGVWWGVKPSHANLGAYYLPGDGGEQLYSHISNVNVFRVVMNTYFSGNYDLLPDVSYNLDDSSENGFAIQPEYLSTCIND